MVSQMLEICHFWEPPACCRLKRAPTELDLSPVRVGETRPMTSYASKKIRYSRAGFLVGAGARAILSNVAESVDAMLSRLRRSFNRPHPVGRAAYTILLKQLVS
jgi:hypothetical protein